ncbi:armadillo-type fold protein [Artemisia annua]|uniref:Armadillo-type fold protein n=1 Tax=Artemisia annua TaxID=35608 RepID=A0A2U1P3V0_ARTAN|nr:armadillo-type fold protein [Artemisia annua]
MSSPDLKKCSRNRLHRVCKIIPTTVIRRALQLLENSIGDRVSWLLHVSTPSNDQDEEYLGLLPTEANEPMLSLIWEHISILRKGTLEERAEAAISLGYITQDNKRYGKLIIEEGGVPPLLKLVEEGNEDGQRNSARAIGLLGQDPQNVEHIVNAGVGAIFARILRFSPMRVQLVVAWAVSELAANYPKCHEYFLQHNVVELLIGHLAFETVEEHNTYAIASKQDMSIDIVVLDNSDTRNEEHKKCQVLHPRPMKTNRTHDMRNVAVNTILENLGKNRNDRSHEYKDNTRKEIAFVRSVKAKEFDDLVTKSQMMVMVARALWYLCLENVAICRRITESQALLCFTKLLEEDEYEVQYISAMALVEITAVAQDHAELRESGFNPTSPATQAVVEQFLKIIQCPNSGFLIPSIQSIGNLARTFPATETRMIIPLMVRLLEHTETCVAVAAAVTLTKFVTRTESSLHVNHCKTIIDLGGCTQLVVLLYLGEEAVQFAALILLCYLALNIPDSETLARNEVPIVLEWATKQCYSTQYSSLGALLQEARQRLKIYYPRGIC